MTATRAKLFGYPNRRVSYCSHTGVSVWRDILFGKRTLLLHIAGSLIMERYANRVVLAVVQPLMQAVFGTLFQQEIALPHVARRNLNSVDEIHMVCWPDLSPMDHVWHLVGLELHRHHRHIPSSSCVLQ